MAPKAQEAPLSSPSNRNRRSNYSRLLSSSKRTARAVSAGRGREVRCVSGLHQWTNRTKNSTISNALLPHPQFSQAKPSTPRKHKAEYSSLTEASVGWSSNRNSSRSSCSYCKSRRLPLLSSDHRHRLQSCLIRITSSCSQEVRQAQVMKKLDKKIFL